MPTRSFSRDLDGHLLDLAWSVWAELGVSGWARRHADVAIDVEPLILFTAGLGDARLRDESTDWCLRYGRFVSKVRLRNLLADGVGDPRAFADYAATVNRDGRLGWLADGGKERGEFRPSERSFIEAFDRPALIALRARAIFGVGARAEIIRFLVADPAVSPTASQLAFEVGYRKRNVAEALESLRLGGLVSRLPVGNALRYSLGAGAGRLALLGDLPAKFPRWPQLVRLLSALRVLSREVAESSSLVRAVEAGRFLVRHAADLVVVGAPSPPSIGPEAWSPFMSWALGFAEALAQNRHGAALDSGRPNRPLTVPPARERRRRATARDGGGAAFKPSAGAGRARRAASRRTG